MKIFIKMRRLVANLFNITLSEEVVENNGDLQVIVCDSLPPEANAMTMAMYSRSPRSFLEHLKEVIKKGWRKFLAQFYVGYGHASIGDCGTTNICAENVSMLCAKAIQQFLLYKGQEASTRYLNMLKQKMLNILGTREGESILEAWLEGYETALKELVPYLKTLHPMKDGDKPSTYEKSINAMAFDIARSLLPAGMTTYVGWHATLREASKHLLELRHHPLQEVREVAMMMSDALHKKYPSSGFDKRYPETEQYTAMCMDGYTYQAPVLSSEFSFSHNFDVKAITAFTRVITERPAKAELPTFLKKFGALTCKFLIDFGSFRDYQRHRSGIILMPPLTTTYGFHEAYLERMPEDLRNRIRALIEVQTQRINSLHCNNEDRQYYIAMGFKVACESTFDLPASVYVAELRSGQTVHFTLRPIAQKIGKALMSIFPDLALHVDMSSDAWSTKRGTHDIVRK